MSPYDALYLLPIIPLVGMELEAAFGDHPKMDTITSITQRFENHGQWHKVLIAFLIILEFSHLVLNFPG